MEVEFYPSEWNGIDVYCCVITNLTAKKRNFALPEIDPALHLENRTNSDVTYLGIIKSEMHYLPQNLSSTFPNLIGLGINGVHLKEISKVDLKGLTSLTDLLVTNCDLRSLPSDLFVFARNLTRIDFGNNMIKHIGKYLLVPLNLDNVKTIDLTENSSINAVFGREESTPLAKHVSIQKLVHIIANKCQKNREVEPVNQYIKDLWYKKTMCDFKFTFSNRRPILVHKNLLAVQSPVFAAMFQTQMTSECKIEDISYKTFLQFLEYLYIRKMPTATDCITELYSTAKKYQVQKLAKLLEEMILDGINGDNALEILKLGNSFDNEIMKICAFNKIKKESEYEIPEGSIDVPNVIEELFAAKNRMKRKQEDVDNEYNDECNAIMKKYRKELAQKQLKNERYADI
jgi:Leucine-rich repeat (LRR) protein